MTENLLEIRGLTISFGERGRQVRVVEGVDLDVGRREVLGIIGESGSGKTVTCMSLMRLLPAQATIEAERIAFEGQELSTMPDSELRRLRGRRVGMIFQDPVGSFNPVKTIGWHFRHAARSAGIGDGWQPSAIALLGRVGIADGTGVLRRYPHQLSGGMLQRALVALVLQMKPSLIIADEPTTNLDNIVEHQIIELFRSLKDDSGASFIFITHDMAVAARLCDRIAVMYAGQIVELGPAQDVLRAPRHPYSQGLVRTAMELMGRVERLREIPGELPNLRALPRGCRFRDRCPQARAGCEAPQPVRDLGEGRRVRCLLYEAEAVA